MSIPQPVFGSRVTYMQYPAATISLPGRNTSEIAPFESSFTLYTPKIVPMFTPASMLLEPSSGSKTTQ